MIEDNENDSDLEWENEDDACSEEWNDNEMNETGTCSIDVIKNSKKQWVSDEKYLTPVLQDDPLLYCFDENFDKSDTNNVEFEEDEFNLILKKIENLTTESENALKNNDKLLSLELKIKIFEEKEILNQRQYNRLLNDFQDYKNFVKDTFFNTAEKRELKEAEKEEIVNEDGDWEMDSYFGSYAGNEIHEQMLKDVVRTESYRDFIYHNKDIFRDKIVLDVGCGTGILSMFAAKAGASKVFSVDNSTIIKKAKKIVKENNLDHIITFFQGKIEDVILPVQKVDIIISEWMGYFLLFEGMLDSVIYARDTWLAHDGFMAPSNSEILLCAVDDENWINDQYNFWNNVYGFKMNVMKEGFLEEAQVDFAEPSSVISNITSLKKIDMNLDTVKSLDFETNFKLKFDKKGKALALLGWFDIIFSHPKGEEIKFSTGPQTTRTHWKQTAFIFQKGIEVENGTSFEGTFRCVKHPKSNRGLFIEIKFKVYQNGLEKDTFSQNFNII
ncbi:Protein arginine N-methyltransferase 3 [Clydaea vesicula]|uniref:type I protein arginine methyltransferase n=1 Tax=Clydaea vesicula TaxID=447962 RepID=A0AAD5U0Z0_9FUNG|nr:Protein arginine N-methyltransferase 3 [Clydaea vesicula]